MADSKRQQICTAIDSRLKSILVSGGYETNIGNNVYEFWEIPLEETELPGMIWRDGAESADLSVTSVQTRTLKIHLTIQVAGTDSPRQIRKALADIEKAIKVDTTWGVLAIDTRPPEVVDTFEMGHEARRIGAARVTFDVIYRTGYLDSYA